MLFAYASTERKHHLGTDTDTDTGTGTTSDHAQQQTPHSSLRHRRHEATTEDIPQRRPRIVGGVNVSASLRIINGTEVSRPNYPYFILWGGCGATLIHNDIALSAAHCSRGVKDAQVGPKIRWDSSNTWTRVDQVLSHPQYDPDTHDYDFAILKLNGWFQSKTVRLNYNKSRPDDGESLKILGFGGQSPILKEGKVEAISANTCAAQWNDAGFEIDESAVICAKSDDGVNPCTGDSGGPLLSSNVQVGVISSGSNNCDGSLPAIYSRVSVAKNWIKSQICELSDFPPLDCLGPISPRPFDTVTVRVDIHLDGYPQDIRWRITTNVGDERTIEVASGGDFEIPNSLESRFVYLQTGAYYEFTIEDISGHADGLGSNGKYSLCTVNIEGNDENRLCSGGRNFKESESSTFAIGNVIKPTQAPSAAPIPRPVLSFPTPSPVTPTNSQTRSQIPKPNLKPTREPTTRKPTVEPTVLPTKDPTRNPTSEPTGEPTSRPTKQPTTSSPTRVPTDEPTSKPTSKPTRTPTAEPTSSPTEDPSVNPTVNPTREPSDVVTAQDDYFDFVYDFGDGLFGEGLFRRSLQYTNRPTASERLSVAPSSDPLPLQSASEPTVLPTDHPSVPKASTHTPSISPSIGKPTDTPVDTLSSSPTTKSSSYNPIDVPSENPIDNPAENPTDVTSDSPTHNPSASSLTVLPSASPTGKHSSDNPMDAASDSPTGIPSVSPTVKISSGNPTDVTSDSPTDNPSASPTTSFSDTPTDTASDSLTDNSSASPTTKSPADVVSDSPTEIVSTSPTTKSPTAAPSDSPTEIASSSPTTRSPIAVPSDSPTEIATSSPTTKAPTVVPSNGPTVIPSASPTTKSPTAAPFNSPTAIPSSSPSTKSPTGAPSDSPTDNPTPSPSARPTDAPTFPVSIYMAYVNVTIFENPEEVGWRIIDALSQERFYGYPAGNYKDATTFTNFLNLPTGIWKFELTRESLAADAKVEVGYLNPLTGGTVFLGQVSFGSDSTATTVSTLMLLT